MLNSKNLRNRAEKTPSTRSDMHFVLRAFLPVIPFVSQIYDITKQQPFPFSMYDVVEC